MNDEWTFSNALHDLQYRLSATWRDKLRVGQKIAVSIQLGDEIQDRARACASKKRSPSGAPEAVNPYCQEILDKQWKARVDTIDCDELDVCLKRRHKSRTDVPDAQGALPGLSCRCHGNVSNILVPFRFRNDVWHIFLGQFLLKREPSGIGARILSEQHIDPVENIAAAEEKFLRENVFVTEEEHAKEFNSLISLVPLPDFLMFKSHVLDEFHAFLSSVYDDPARTASLDHYKKEINVFKLRKLCPLLMENVKSHPRIVLNCKNRVSEVVNWIAQAANNEHVTLAEKQINTYIGWVRRGLAGHISNQKWLVDGEQLVTAEVVGAGMENHKCSPLNVPSWWLACARFGANSFLFSGGVGVLLGLVANIIVGFLLSRSTFSYWSWFGIALSSLSIIVVGYCIHNIAHCVKAGEDAFAVARSIEVESHEYVANDSWPLMEARPILRTLTFLSPVVVVILTVGVFAFSNRPFQSEQVVPHARAPTNAITTPVTVPERMPPMNVQTNGNVSNRN